MLKKQDCKMLTIQLKFCETLIFGKTRPSDRVRGCGTAQFGQTRTIKHNSQKPAKSRTILRDLLKHLIKSGMLLITTIPKNLLGYFQAIYLPKQSRNPSLSSIARADVKRKAFFRHSAPAWALVLLVNISNRVLFSSVSHPRSVN